MNKLITEGLSAIKELSLQKVKEQLVTGKIHPTAYESLAGHEQLYVKLVVFERRSPEMACKIVADKICVIDPSLKITAEELRMRYMLDTRIKQAISELLNAQDIESSLLIQSQAQLAQEVITGLMLNSESEEIRLRAAGEIMKYAASDYKDKRSKTHIEKQTTNIDAKVVWEIKAFDKTEALPDQRVIDATIATEKKYLTDAPLPEKEENDTSLKMSFDEPEDEDGYVEDPLEDEVE